nr:MAG TPA: hypothetical protein [Caudoviricetes sp.]
MRAWKQALFLYRQEIDENRAKKAEKLKRKFKRREPYKRKEDLWQI